MNMKGAVAKLQPLCLVLFALRRVILLRSDIVLRTVILPVAVLRGGGVKERRRLDNPSVSFADSSPYTGEPLGAVKLDGEGWKE